MYDIYENAKRYCPTTFKYAVECERISEHELVFIFEDGSREIYDDFDKTTRTITNIDSTPSMDDYKNDFGIRLRRLLRYKNMTRCELAERIGVDRSIIGKYIKGTHAPSLYVACAIAKALDCSLNDLVYF